jgi:hypothetical protein
MKEHYFTDGTEPTILPHMPCCKGPCQQGRKACPTPQACELDDDNDVIGSMALHIALVITALVVLFVLFIALL